jgi:L-lactate dehydrogenase complex protein LldG
MNSREQILAKIKSVRREESLLPDIPDFGFSGEIKDRFVKSIQANKGEVINEAELLEFLKKNQFTKIISLAKGLEEVSTTNLPENPHELADLEVAMIEGQFGVAENGAIWLTDADLGLRALPFITEHLVILLREESLVSNMHEAYRKIEEQQSGFGLFIAGPSKTADIEQSLVIGAHGAKSLRVVLMQ